MSLLSRLRDRRLVAHLAPARVTLACAAGRWRPRLVEAPQAAACEPQPGMPDWSGAVRALEHLVAGRKEPRPRLAVVLSNHFVRYAVVPREPGLSGEDEELAHARYHFSRVHGEAAAGWDVRLAPAAGTRPRLASAVDRALLDALRERFAPDSRVRLDSVRPWLVPAYNALRGRAPWMLLVEPGRACVACAPDGHWLTVRTPAGDYSRPESWPALLDRVLLQCDGAPGEVRVRAASNADFAPFASGPWRFASGGRCSPVQEAL